MKLPRSAALLAALPFAVLVLVQGCTGGSTGTGECAVLVDDAGPAEEGTCANGPKQGTSCCVSSTSSCASTLPLCQSICCTTANVGEGGTVAIEREAGTNRVLPDASFVETSPDASVVTSACPGNKQTGTFLNASCQAALEQRCCMELKACFNGTSDAFLDCNEYSMCIDFCGTAANRATCESDCDATTTAAVRNAYEAIVTCATNDSVANAACQ